MKKILSFVCILILLVACFSGCSAPKRTLNLYTWAGMFPPEVLEEFESTTGIKINYSNYDYGETMLSRLGASAGEYDLIIADDYIIEAVISQNLAQKLDYSLIPSAKNINPLYKGQFFDKNDEYSIPYGAGVQTIVYDPAKVSLDISGYADLWDSSLNDKLGIISNYRVINGMALKTMGESYNTQDLNKISAAGEKLKQLAPNIRLIKDDNIQDDLLSGEIDVAIMYTSQVTLAKMTNPSLKVVFPKEGIGFGIMSMFVPSSAKDASAAHEFMEYILTPEVSAKCFEYIGFYCTNSAADSLISEQYRPFLTLPESFTAENMEMIQNVSSEADQAHLDIFTAFRGACE